MTGPALLYVGRLVSLEVGVTLATALVGISFFVIATRFGSVVRWFSAFARLAAARGSRVPILGRLIPRQKVDRMQQLCQIQIDFWTAGRVYLLTIAQILMMVLRSHLAARAVGLQLPFLVLLLAAPVAQLGQLLAFTPGALGIRELSWIGVLQATGIPREDLLAFVVGHRAYVYLSILVLALISHVMSTIWPPRAASTSPVAADTAAAPRGPVPHADVWATERGDVCVGPRPRDERRTRQTLAQERVTDDGG